MIRVQLPYHLRNLAKVQGEINLAVAPPVTLHAVLDALEAAYPVLKGTIREHATLHRRAFVRFFACKEDISDQGPQFHLPQAIADGHEPLLIVGALAGG